MTEQRGVRILTASFVAALAVVGWQEIKYNSTNSPNSSPIGWPRPERFVGVGIVYGMLGLLADFISAQLAAVLGAGMLVGTLMQASNSDTLSGAGPTYTGGSPVITGVNV